MAVGTEDEIVEHLLACRRRWGISSLTLRSIDEFVPIIERLRAVDAEAA
ncbi:MAG: hypothetical protein ABIR68_14375 [Ilumatobacteraceae bacterium]